MQNPTCKRFNALRQLQIPTIVTFSTLILIVISASSALAQKAMQETFSSADEASRALFLAVQEDNEQALFHMFGGRNELVSSDDQVADKREREQFARKYEEMHRMVREPNGITLLYVGAENWPFPVPLVSKAGAWYFDAEAGTAEILFRRVGENEAIAIETCHALVQAKTQPMVKAIEGDPAARYAQTLVGADNPGKDIPVNRNELSGPFHGYYFRMLTAQRGSGAGAKATVSDTIPESGYAFIAYPAEYRSSGVLTFVVTRDDRVFKRDLGPNTGELTKRIVIGTPFKSWQVAQ